MEFCLFTKIISIISADTAGSAKFVSEQKKKNEGAIASKLAAKIYNLEILKSNIEDETGNVTRFFIMGSNTKNTLTADLDGRTPIVVHRGDEPDEILSKIKSDKCFIIGGGKTYSKFAQFLTHIFLTPHPLIIGKGIPLFSDLLENLELEFLNMLDIDSEQGIYQYQYKVKRDIHHTH